ncbi:hypothetical protein SISNIDRAFT_459652 [Sistotremastrum niveocremeum HHB9708]|uniref:Uncharacterized protein n=1 Tax=Sistotremastrum niveocremeum HHB9708 TaxID=1314777 RepID=A0A164PCS8_9AGAM|nr:hypothetical protein SISNIDRAFT_459652 [Sistotremastrum niveocremeum HHB9708]
MQTTYCQALELYSDRAGVFSSPVPAQALRPEARLNLRNLKGVDPAADLLSRYR